MSNVYTGVNKELYHLMQKETTWQNYKMKLIQNTDHFRDWEVSVV